MEETWPFSDDYINKYFDSEHCASLHTDVPWKNANEADPQSKSAGGIPGWQTYVTMDAQGGTIYSSSVYPPSKYKLSPLMQQDPADVTMGWGSCSNIIRWGTASLCNYSQVDQQQHGSACFPGITTCLPVGKSSSSAKAKASDAPPPSPPVNEGSLTAGQGVCFSTATYAAAAALVRSTPFFIG